MSADQLGLPAFTPVPARPAQLPPANSPPTQPAGKKAKDPQKAKAAKAPKQAKGAKKRAVENTRRITNENAKRAAANEPAKRVRSTRVAALTLDASSALAALAGMSKRELEAMQTLIAQLNPLPRPARKRVLEAVAKIAGAS